MRKKPVAARHVAALKAVAVLLSGLEDELESNSDAAQHVHTAHVVTGMAATQLQTLLNAQPVAPPSTEPV